MWLKRAVAITLAVTFVLFGSILIWGFGFDASQKTAAVAGDDNVPTIAPVDTTQPGHDDVAVGPGSPASGEGGAAAQPTAVPGTSAATPAPAGSGSSGGSTGGGGGSTAPPPTAAPTPAPTAPPAACGSGGTCHLADIQGHSSAGDCRSAINVDGTTNAYAISQTFLTTHGNQYKQIVSKLCGKAYTANLKQAVGEHRDGTMINGSIFQQYINNFYIGPYN